MVLDDLFLLWSGLGYYRRIENIYEASKIISRKYNNKFPRDFDDILSLPGIGKTTASAISTFSGFSNKAILDGNVKRILRRYFDISKVNNSNVMGKIKLCNTNETYFGIYSRNDGYWLINMY